MKTRTNSGARTTQRAAGLAIGAAVLLGGALVVGREVAGGSSSPTTSTMLASPEIQPPVPSTHGDFLVPVTEPPTPTTPTTSETTNPATTEQVAPGITVKPAQHFVPATPTTVLLPPPPTVVAPPTPSHQVLMVQQLLNESGVTVTIPVDGLVSQAFVDALLAFQSAVGLPQSGVVDAATLRQLKIAALNAVLRGTWAGSVISGGSAIGQLMVVIAGDGSSSISFSYSPCVGSSSFVDFDGFTLTSAITLQAGADCTTVTTGLAHLHFLNINQLSWSYADSSSGVLTRL